MAVGGPVLCASDLQDLSEALAAAAAANAELMLPSGADKEMKKLSESIQEIAPFVEDDAKARRRKSNAQPWLREVHGIVCELQSILQLLSPPKEASNQIPAGRRIFSEMDNLQDPVMAGPKLPQELKAIRSKLDKILKKQNLINHRPLQAGTVQEITNMAISRCPVEPLTVSGRDEKDKNKIIPLLLAVKEAKGPHIIPIVREGASTTTELARAIFDDKRVVNHFVRRFWVSATDFVDPTKLARLVRKPASTVFWVHKTLNEDSEEEQLLLVLDEVRTSKRAAAAYGGNIIKEKAAPWLRVSSVETKQKVVVSTLKRGHPFYPGNVVDPPRSARLSAAGAWKLFEECALEPLDDGARRGELVEIGRGIAGKLGGVKLMIKKIGEMLRAKQEAGYWKLILESRVWELPLDEELAGPTLAELCYRPWQARSQHFVARYAGGSKGVQRVDTLFFK